MKFDFDDILLTPEILSSINSRSEVNPFDENGMLPIMTAPMDTVIDQHNMVTFMKNKINVVMPRQHGGISENLNVFYSYGLDEFKEFFLDSDITIYNVDFPVYALIDVANGHMSNLYKYAVEAKEKYGDKLVLMIGNIANPQTYQLYAKAGVDYIRCGIGGGQGCLTSVQTGVGYPMASLISEIYKIKTEGNYSTKIVADGGFKKFADINKALALGCFLPHATVNISEGKKRIEDIKVGDYVYTHMNRLRKVINTWEYDNDKTIVEINGIPSTSNHHYYVVNKKYKHLVTEENVHSYAEWIAAENLSDEYLLVNNS